MNASIEQVEAYLGIERPKIDWQRDLRYNNYYTAQLGGYEFVVKENPHMKSWEWAIEYPTINLVPFRSIAFGSRGNALSLQKAMDEAIQRWVQLQ